MVWSNFCLMVHIMFQFVLYSNANRFLSFIFICHIFRTVLDTIPAATCWFLPLGHALRTIDCLWASSLKTTYLWKEPAWACWFVMLNRRVTILELPDCNIIVVLGRWECNIWILHHFSTTIWPLKLRYTARTI